MDVILEMTVTAPSPVALSCWDTDRNWHRGHPIPSVGASGPGSCLLQNWLCPSATSSSTQSPSLSSLIRMVLVILLGFFNSFYVLW